MTVAKEHSEQDQYYYDMLIQVGLALSRAQELHDPYTTGHGFRVSLIAKKVAERLKWEHWKILYLELSGLLHDIGKLGIPSAILMKPDKLTELERELVKGHVTMSYEVLKELHFPFPLAEIVYQHHERLDGSGYPRGLKGEDMLIEGKILAVADVLESLTVKRPYRPELSLYDTIDILRDDAAANKLDAEIVDIVIQLIKEKGDKFWV